MPIFKLSGKITVSTYTEVEAGSLEEAIELSEEREAVIGGVGSGYYAYDSWIVDDADGTPFDITEDK